MLRFPLFRRFGFGKGQSGVVALGMLKVVEGAFHLKKGRFEDNFLVLVWGGNLCIREWTSLTSERVKNDPAFAVTMVYANVQTLASKTSSRVYAQVTGERHVYSLYVLLKRIAYQLFKKGYAIETVYTWLREAVGEQGFWWEEWAEGVQPKVVVEEIVRVLSESRQRRDRLQFGGIIGIVEKETAAGKEEEIKHLDHKEHKKTLSNALVLLRELRIDIGGAGVNGVFRLARGQPGNVVAA